MRQMIFSKDQLKERVRFLMARGFNNGDIGYVLGITIDDVRNLYPDTKDDCPECGDAIYKADLSSMKERLLKAKAELYPKSGKWKFNNALFDEWTCSNCNFDSNEQFDYCPNCGAKMVDAQESEGV